MFVPLCRHAPSTRYVSPASAHIQLFSDCPLSFCISVPESSPELALQWWLCNLSRVPGSHTRVLGELGSPWPILAKDQCSLHGPGRGEEGCPGSANSPSPLPAPPRPCSCWEWLGKHAQLSTLCCRGHDANQTERIAKEVKGALFGFGMSPGPESFPHSFPRQQWFLNPECQSSRKHTVSSISSHSSQKFQRQC